VGRQQHPAAAPVGRREVALGQQPQDLLADPGLGGQVLARDPSGRDDRGGCGGDGLAARPERVAWPGRRQHAVADRVRLADGRRGQLVA
jgi:hypothetical protein